MRIREAQKHTDPDADRNTGTFHLHPSSKIKIIKKSCKQVFLNIFAWWRKDLEPDPYLWPGFQIRINLIRIRIQHFRLNTDPDPDPFRIRGLYDQNLTKFKAEKKIELFFWLKTTIYLTLGLHKRRPSYKRSLQLSKENIHHLKTWNFLIFFYFWGSFLPSWIQIRIPNTCLDPDPLTNWIPACD